MAASMAATGEAQAIRFFEKVNAKLDAQIEHRNSEEAVGAEAEAKMSTMVSINGPMVIYMVHENQAGQAGLAFIESVLVSMNNLCCWLARIHAPWFDVGCCVLLHHHWP